MIEIVEVEGESNEINHALSRESGKPEPPHQSGIVSVTIDDVKTDVTSSERAWSMRKTVDYVISLLTNQLFFCAMVVVIIAAWGAPWVGKKGGPLRTEYSVTYGVNGLVFFISGLSLKTRSLIDAFLNMRLNIMIQSWVFGFTPGLFYLLYIGLRESVHIDKEIADGFCLLGCLPMTINMCYVLTSSSNGNDSSALFNATFGNIIGIFLSPLLILGMLSISGAVSYQAVILKLTFQVVCPLVAGQILLNAGSEDFRQWLTSIKKNMKLSQEALLSLVVYSSFCNTFAGEVDINPVSIVIIALVIFVVQFGLFALAWWFYNIPALGFDTKDAIAGMFCSVHKTMALGVPVISSMYEDSPAGSGVYSIPLLIYHPLLAVSGSILVPIMKRKVAETEASKEGDQTAKVDLENGLDGSQPSAGASVKPVHATYGVLGATGNVGKHVVACLKQSMKEANNGETLVVFSRAGTPSDGYDDASIISGSVDMSSPSSIKNALRKYRVQVLFVAMPQALASAQMVACGTAITEGLLPLPGGAPGSEYSHTVVVRLSSYRIEPSESLPCGQGALGMAHIAAEAELADKGIRYVSVRPVSFFSNFEKYDLPALVTALRDSQPPCISSPLGHETTARVNWVSCEDVGAVSATCMTSLVRNASDCILKQHEQAVRVTVTGGPENSLTLQEYCEMLGFACNAVMTKEGKDTGGAISVRCTDLPLPIDHDYADLWRFLRAGGFDVASSSVEDLTGKRPKAFLDHVQKCLLEALSVKSA